MHNQKHFRLLPEHHILRGYRNNSTNHNCFFQTALVEQYREGDCFLFFRTKYVPGECRQSVPSLSTQKLFFKFFI